MIDDGSIGDRRGSLTIDDEGTPTQRNVLIEDGILKGYIQDRLNARLMGVAPTGNGRRENFAHAPMPRMTNTFMLGGKDDPGEILARAKNGIYAKSFGGGQVDITIGQVRLLLHRGLRIENGKLGAPIKGATLIGDGPTVLTKVAAIGDDMALDEGVGICGKGGQSVPAGVGQPTLLIEGLTVGGTAGVNAGAGPRGPRFLVRASAGTIGGRPIPSFDAEIRERFRDALGGAARECRPSISSARADEALAAVILFDQFPRNMFRGHADQFSTDPLALAIAKGAIEHGYDDGMTPDRRGFLYMPFQHSEDLRDQRQSLLLFTALGDAEQLDYARKHHDVIERFGRFPHRNAMLGRKPTAMEQAAGDVVPW